MANTYYDKNQYLRKHQPDQVNEVLDPLNLDLDDEVLAKAIDRRVDAAEKFYNSDDIRLKERRRKNKDYLYGKQKDIRQLKRYQIDFTDNLIYEAESTIKPIALSRLPDLLVKPAKDNDDARLLATNMTKLVNSDLRKRENRKVLGMAWKHLPVYFLGVIKAYWDPFDGKYGDYKFKSVHPERITIDHTAATPDDATFVDESIDMSIQEMIMRWPEKEADIRELCAVNSSNEDEKLASMVTFHEVWFKWWEKNKNKEDVNARDKTEMPTINGWQEVNGVCWKYKTLILGKMKNPYFDWSGNVQLHGENGQIDISQMQDVLNGTIQAEVKKIFNNYFQRPKFPYIFLTYDQWGEYPLDFTSRIEQSLSLQENHNKRGMQISDMNDRSRGKNIFSTAAGLTKKEIEKLDMDNPYQDLVVAGKINEAHSYIQGVPAPPALYQELDSGRERLFSKEGVNSTTRGQKQGNETATGLQIYREADFGRIDDEVEDTINAAAEQLGSWALQFIRLFYDEEHVVSFLGPDGTTDFMAFTRDAIDDGMEVVVTASGVDRLMAKQEAYERARMQMTDPLSFLTDINASDPRGRVEKMMMFQTAPELYLQTFITKQNTAQMAQNLNQQPVGGTPAPGAAAPPGGAAPPVPGVGGGAATAPPTPMPRMAPVAPPRLTLGNRIQ